MPTQLLARALLTPLLALAVHGCGAPEDVYSLAEWRDVLKGNGNWHVVKVPDSKLVPGSIVKVTKDEGLAWIDSLHSCGIPANLLVAKPIASADATLIVLGASPSISFKKKMAFSADAILNVAGVTAGPEFAKVRNVTLAMGANGGDALRMIRLQDWIRDNPGAFKQSCVDELAKKDRYLAVESFRISSATYGFLDQTGARLKLTLPQIGRIVQLQPSLKFDVTAEGDLRIDEPMYVAVRQAVSASAGFETLGVGPGPAAAGPGSGDDLLASYNLSRQ